MRILVKYPGKAPEVIEVEGMRDINKLTGNVDADGNGVYDTGTDYRTSIGPGVDLYCKTNAAYNTDLEPNLWNANNFILLCGTIVFAGYDDTCIENFGACSLTDEQIEYCRMFAAKQQYP